MRSESRESEYRGKQRKQYFEDPNYRKWSDIMKDNYSYGDYRERALIRCYLDCNDMNDNKSLSKIHEVMSSGKFYPINWETFYAYFDERLNDPDNPYMHEMNEKMFPFMDDSPTVIELLNQYREILLSSDYDLI
jgi:hypothetical protein